MFLFLFRYLQRSHSSLVFKFVWFDVSSLGFCSSWYANYSSKLWCYCTLSGGGFLLPSIQVPSLWCRQLIIFLSTDNWMELFQSLFCFPYFSWWSWKCVCCLNCLQNSDSSFVRKSAASMLSGKRPVQAVVSSIAPNSFCAHLFWNLKYQCYCSLFHDWHNGLDNSLLNKKGDLENLVAVRKK